MENNTIIIDFETRSEVDLKACGPWVYAEHPSTEILCIGFKNAHRTGVIVPRKFHVEKALTKALPGAYMEDDNTPIMGPPGVIFEAHNAEFERAIWHHICHKRWGWPDTPIERWRCSAAKAAALALPRTLDKVCKVLRLPVQKDSEGRALMLKMCKPRKPLKAEKLKWLRENPPDLVYKTEEQLLKYAEERMPTLWHESPDQLVRLFKYCLQDVEAEYCLSQNLPELNLKEQKVWFFDQRINTRGVQVDTESAKAALSIIDDHEKIFLKELKDLTHGTVESPRQVAALKAWLSTRGVNLPDLQKATIENALKDTDSMNPSAKRALEIRQSLSKSSTAKFKAMLNSTNEDGRARGLFMYHGATTGRWTGKRIQTQNLVRSEFKDIDACLEVINEKNEKVLQMLWGDPMRALASCMRGFLIAAPGKDLICADFKSIEAMVIAWLAGEDKVLRAFIEGLDLYKVAASSIYDVDYDDVSPQERQVGKVAVLALGYQGGVGAFQSMAGNYGVIVEDELADEIKTSWREAHQNIVSFWYATEKAALRAVRYGTTENVRGIKWGVHGKFLYCKLPSNRLLAYYKPEIRIKAMPWGDKETITYYGTDTYTTQWTRIHTYGGKLVENIVQAVARDLLAEAIIRVEEAGYPVVMHVHDEIVSEIPEGFGSVKEFEDLMAVRPHWAEGCPIGAEGWRGKRYKK